MNKTRIPIKKILVLFLLWALGLFIVCKLSSRALPNRTSYEIEQYVPISLRSSILPWVNFDGRNYLDIASHGYRERAGQNLRGFLPLYPLFIWLLSTLHLHPIYWGLFFSAVFYFLALIVYYLHTRSIRPLVLLTLSPAAYYFLSLYTESLFLLVTLSFFYFLKNKRYHWAGFFAVIASLTKVIGFSLPLILFVSMIPKVLKDRKYSFVALCSTVGIVGLLIYFYFTTGNPFVFVSSQLTFSRRIGLFSPILAFWDWGMKVLNGNLPIYDSPFVYPVIILEFLSGVFFLVMTIKTFTKITNAEWWYTLISLFLVIFSGSLWSVPRYLLVVFPIFTYISQKAPHKFFIVICVLSAIFQVLLSALFFRGYWVS